MGFKGSEVQILSLRQRVGLDGLTRNKSAELVETFLEIIKGIREIDNEVLIGSPNFKFG